MRRGGWRESSLRSVWPEDTGLWKACLPWSSPRFPCWSSISNRTHPGPACGLCLNQAARPRGGAPGLWTRSGGSPSCPQLRKQNGPHPMAPSSQGNQPSCVTPEFLRISRYPPHAKQRKSTWTQAGFCVCLSPLNKEPKTASWQKHGEIKYLNSTHVCWITEFLYFHGPQNVLERPQVSQKESSHRLLTGCECFKGGCCDLLPLRFRRTYSEFFLALKRSVMNAEGFVWSRFLV